MAKRRILITGAGSGFGRGAALGLAEKGHDVIAGVYAAEQVAEMRKEAASRRIPLRVEKLDLLSDFDREAASKWDIDVLVNNGAIGEGGPIGEIPLELVRRVFEINVFATLALTQSFLKQMVKRGQGRIVFVSSIAGLRSAAYLGAYCASKHALEAIAESLHYELAPHGIQIATLNPGPYATGFNDRMVESPSRWYDPKRNFTRAEDLKRLAQHFEKQFDPQELIEAMIGLVEADSGLYRNVHPKQSEERVRHLQEEAWTRQQTSSPPVARVA
jgi:NAD(P)-dependent dehydrogenase (short-subunit alcohol dehydrogenase family)